MFIRPYPDETGAPVLADAPPSIPTPEAVPAPEPEQAVPPEQADEADSGAPAKEDEATQPPSLGDIRAQTLAQIEELRESDPELAAELTKRFGEKAEDLTEERAKWDLERGQEQRNKVWQEATMGFSRFRPEAARADLVNALTQLNEQVQDAASELSDGRITDPKQVRFDPAGWADYLLPIITGGQDAASNLVLAWTKSVTFGALEGHVAHRHLTAEERKQYREYETQGKIEDALKLHLDAAIRAAPAEATKKAKEEAAKEAGLLEAYRKTQEALGSRNGKKSLTGAGSNTVGYANINDAEEAYLTSKISHEQYKAIREKLLPTQ